MANNIMKNWDIDDNQIKTPQHDELIFDLLDEKNIIKIHNIIGLKCEYKKEKKLETFWSSWGHTNDHGDVDHVWHDHKNDSKIYYVEIPSSIKNDKQEHEFCELTQIQTSENFKEEHINIQSEKVLYGYGGSIRGFIDIFVNIKTTKTYFKDEICPKNNEIIRRKEYENIFDEYLMIEVKPVIDSFGAVLRQINSYQDYMNNNYRKSSVHNPILYTPDERYDAQFASQNVIVIHPKQIK